MKIISTLIPCFFLIFLFPLFTQRTLAQCQLCYFNKKQAEVVHKFLQTQKEIIVFAACEKNDIARKVVIKEIKIVPSPDYAAYFEIHVKGIVTATFDVVEGNIKNYAPNDINFEESIDLSYVHIQTGSFYLNNENRYVIDATCLGIYLGYECDPCIDPFVYPTQVR